MILNLEELGSKLAPEVLLEDIKTEDMKEEKDYTIIAKNGIFMTKKSKAVRVTTQLDSWSESDGTKKGLGRLPMLKQKVEVLVPKIPFKYYMMVLDYFREVYKKQGSEAGVVIFAKTEDTDMDYVKKLGKDGLIIHDDFIIYCPQQENSAAIHVIEGEELYEYLLEKAIQVLELHSHHRMGIGWSGTDDANMKNFRQYTVYNHIEKLGKTQTRTYHKGNFIDFKDSDMFEIPFAMENVLLATEENKEGSHDVKVLSNVEDVLDKVSVTDSYIDSLNEHPSTWIERSNTRVYRISNKKGSKKGKSRVVTSVGNTNYKYNNYWYEDYEDVNQNLYGDMLDDENLYGFNYGNDFEYSDSVLDDVSREGDSVFDDVFGGEYDYYDDLGNEEDSDSWLDYVDGYTEGIELGDTLTDEELDALEGISKNEEEPKERKSSFRNDIKNIKNNKKNK